MKAAILTAIFLVCAASLSGCAVPFERIDTAYQGVSNTKYEFASRVYYYLCNEPPIRWYIDTFGDTEETWQAAFRACRRSGRPSPLPRPSAVDVQEEAGAEVIPFDLDGEGGPIEFGVIQ